MAMKVNVHKRVKKKGQTFSPCISWEFQKVENSNSLALAFGQRSHVRTLLVAEALPKLKTFNAFLSFEQ